MMMRMRVTTKVRTFTSMRMHRVARHGGDLLLRGAFTCALGVLWTCGGDADRSTAGSDSPEGQAAVETTDAPGPTTLPGSDEDWDIMREKVRWAYEQGLAELPMGDLVARIGETFVGTPYAPHTLEVAGEERLVVELQELDCVTFVENVLALARFVQMAPHFMVDDPAQRFRPFYSGILERIRYREGTLDGYPSRLHYFSEWISDNDTKGILRNISEELGGVVDTERIDFMTTHADAYRQLGEDPEFLPALQAVESRLNESTRFYVPAARIAEVADRIHDGDVIAATSTVVGLDIAHTGIALWRDGRLHLLHAPLVGGVVQISEVPLAERILRIGSQDGVMVARPLDAR